MIQILLLLNYFIHAEKWTKLGRSPADLRLEFTIAIKHSSTSRSWLESTFWDVSNPKSENYAKYLTMEEIAQEMKPSNKSVEIVKKWLNTRIQKSDIHISSFHDYIRCVINVQDAEQLLPGVQYFKFQHFFDGTIAHRVDTFDLPSHLRPHVDFISPTTTFPSPQTSMKLPTNLETNPSTIRQLYGIGTFEAKGAPGNSQQVAGFLNNSFSPSDLQQFFSNYYPKGKGRTAKIVGPNDASNPTIEASLDVQYIMATGANVPTTFWSTPGQRPYPGGENEPFVTWLTAVVESSPLPTVISVSYADEEFVIDPDFQARADVEFMKLGVAGVTLLFGSGDNGVTGDKGVCPGGKFVPWWPASSPYVTAVGATEEYETQGAPFSGGGFSNRYGIPQYQIEAINSYHQKRPTPSSQYYNTTGAGFPDVAAVGLQFWTYVGGIPTEIGGTSASTPVVAGIISLLNDARMSAGKKPLGNVNQLFYQHPEVFTDITKGTNTGGGGCGVGGFTAAIGWDPITGMGTPNFQKLYSLVLSLS